MRKQDDSVEVLLHKKRLLKINFFGSISFLIISVIFFFLSWIKESNIYIIVGVISAAFGLLMLTFCVLVRNLINKKIKEKKENSND